MEEDIYEKRRNSISKYNMASFNFLRNLNTNTHDGAK